MIAEIDARALFGDRNDVVEDGLEGLGRHEIRNECRDAALRRRRRLPVGVAGFARARNVLPVPKMQVDVDGARHDHETPRRHLLLSGNAFPGPK